MLVMCPYIATYDIGRKALVTVGFQVAGQRRRHAKAGPEWAISAIIAVLGGIDRRIEVSDRRGFGARCRRINELQVAPVLTYGP